MLGCAPTSSHAPPPAASSAAVPSASAPGADSIQSGDVSLVVDPQVGARVVALSRAGQNWLTGPDANPTNYGSTFWTSPQSDWSWPPPPEIDALPYSAVADGDPAWTFRSREDAALGVTVTKSFQPGASPGSISIRYSIANDAGTSRSLAPWEVTRVRRGGLFFFPTGAGGASADAGPPLAIEQAAGATWFDSGATPPTGNVKYFADGSRGWLAYASGGVVLVKKFADVPPSAQAPGEAEIELYVSGDGAYLELEVQGPYGPIAPGSSIDWTVDWHLVAIPSDVAVAVGSAPLVAFVDGL